jgi:hypothetical protein
MLWIYNIIWQKAVVVNTMGKEYENRHSWAIDKTTQHVRNDKEYIFEVWSKYLENYSTHNSLKEILNSKEDKSKNIASRV